jgi:hypothetical protein
VRYLFYSKSDESYALDTVNALAGSRGAAVHWLYAVNYSAFFEGFKERNPHLNPQWDLKHYLVATSNDIIDVIAIEPPIVSTRSDDIRGWIRPGEVSD